MKVHLSGHGLPRHAGKPCDDAWVTRQRGEIVIGALADGVGSCREGGVAAKRAVEMFADCYLSRPRAWSPRRALAEFTALINRQLHQESMERHGTPELACTLAAVVVESGRLYGCNVGDSSVFHASGGRLQRLSEAHVLTDAEQKHVLTRGLGFEPTVDPHFFEAPIADGDSVLLCSDGVTNPLSETQLGELLRRRASARQIATNAHDTAQTNGAFPDDSSAIVIEIIQRGHASVERQSLDVLPTLREGDLIDEHRLIRALASGGRVWLAHAKDGSSVVLKFPPIDAADSETLRDAFVRETWNASRLSSPDLVRAWTPAGGTLRYYAMEFVDAPTLRTALRHGFLRVDEARELARFLVRVGQFLLRHDLAHGDIKPDNLLVLRTEGSVQFRLLDLGLAAELYSITSRAGTPTYLAPERYRGAPVSERTEIFSIGVTLYEALTGNYPYGEVERFQTPRFETFARRPTRFNADIPPWLESLLLRALEPNPERRYQTFSELAFDLEHPTKVVAYHRKDAPLLERNPVLFYKAVCLVLLAINAWLLFLLTRR